MKDSRLHYTNEASNKNGKRKVAPGYMALGILLFMIAFYATGKGLETTGFLGLGGVGGFALSFVLMVLISLSFHQALQGRSVAVPIFISLACINMIFNFNFLWPRYVGHDLMIEEAAEMQDRFVKLKANADKRLSRADTDRVRVQARAEIDNLAQQYRLFGYGPQAERQTVKLEGILKTAVPRYDALRPSLPQSRLDLVSEEIRTNLYALADAQLKPVDEALLGELDLVDGYIKQLEEYKVALKSDKLTVDRGATALLDSMAQSFNQLCKRIKSIDQGFRCDGQVQESPLRPLPEEKNIVSYNRDIGTFGHTFRTAWQQIANGNMWMLLLLCFLIDILLPFVLYRLGRIEEEMRPAGRLGLKNKIEGL